jgi:hypothetical protein
VPIRDNPGWPRVSPLSGVNLALLPATRILARAIGQLPIRFLTFDNRRFRGASDCDAQIDRPAVWRQAWCNSGQQGVLLRNGRQPDGVPISAQRARGTAPTPERMGPRSLCLTGAERAGLSEGVVPQRSTRVVSRSKGSPCRSRPRRRESAPRGSRTRTCAWRRSPRSRGRCYGPS